MDLPLEIMQKIVDCLPSKELTDSLASYQIYKCFQSYQKWHYLDLPYKIGKHVFSFAMIINDPNLARSVQSKNHQIKYFRTLTDEKLILKSIQNNSEMLDIMQTECSSKTECYFADLNMTELMESNSLCWWMGRGLDLMMSREMVEQLCIINKTEMDRYFQQGMTFETAKSFVQRFPEHTNKVWHLFENRPDEMEYVLALAHPNIGAIIRRHTPHEWYKHIINIYQMFTRHNIANAMTVVSYLLEHEAEFSGEEWHTIHRTMIKYLHRTSITRYLKIVKQLWAKHFDMFFNHHEPEGIEKNKNLVILDHFLKERNTELSKYLRSYHLDMVYQHLADPSIRVDVCHIVELCTNVLVNIQPEHDTAKPIAYLTIARSICTLAILDIDKDVSLYRVVEECLKREGVKELLPEFLKLEFFDRPLGDVKKANWKKEIQELLPLFKRYLEHMSTKEVMIRVYGSEWSRYWNFDEDDELLSYVSSIGIMSMSKCNAEKYWRACQK